MKVKLINTFFYQGRRWRPGVHDMDITEKELPKSAVNLDAPKEPAKPSVLDKK